MAELDPHDHSVIAEERALLERVHGALGRALARGRKSHATIEARDTLRALRDEALRTSDDDLPGVLHELDLQQRLAARAREPEMPSVESPYIAHLRVAESGRTKDYCLGHTTLIDAAADVRVVDWRTAPIARVFYEQREGDEYEEEMPTRVALGRVLARRLVVIENGVLTRILCDGYALERGEGDTWHRVSRASFTHRASNESGFGVGIGARAREAVAITASLDAEQFAAITSPAERPLLVLGSAGSGKTTVALHRLSRLLVAHEASARAHVIVPEEGLARWTKRLLAPHSHAHVSVRTLDAWALHVAEATFARRIAVCPDTPAEAVSVKRHPAFFRALGLRMEQVTFARPSFKLLREALADMLTDRALLSEVVGASRGTLTRASIETIVRHTMAQLATPTRTMLASITDASMKQAVDGRDLAEDTPEAVAGTVDAEDLPLLLFMRARLTSLDDARIAHVVLDEAEDFSLADLAVVRALLERDSSITLAGDEAQQTSSCFESWPTTLDALGARDAVTCRLAVSYRCPKPIVELSHAVLGTEADVHTVKAARDGAPVGALSFPEETQAFLFARDALADLEAREPHASIAVIANDVATARRFYASLSDTPSVRLVLDGEFTFAPGVDVTHLDAVKGLEFDYVLVPDATHAAYPDTPEARRRLHVAITRASHQLFVVAGGRPTSLIEALLPRGRG